MSESTTDYLRHILEEAAYLADRAAELTRDEFMQDPTLRRAFVRSLEVIGEATKKLPAWSGSQTTDGPFPIVILNDKH